MLTAAFQMKTRFLTFLAFCALGGLASQEAQAAPIVGDIDFNGVVTFDTMSLDSATQVSLWNFTVVTQRTGDFTPFVSVGNNPAMSAPWIFNSGTPGAPLPGPALNALWSVGNFTFDLTMSQVAVQSSGLLNVTGFGTVSGNGFDPTPGLWSFTAVNDGSPQATFSFQANTSVPEAETTAFLVMGGLGLVALTYRRWRRDATAETIA